MLITTACDLRHRGWQALQTGASVSRRMRQYALAGIVEVHNVLRGDGHAIFRGWPKCQLAQGCQHLCSMP